MPAGQRNISRCAQTSLGACTCSVTWVRRALSVLLRKLAFFAHKAIYARMNIESAEPEATRVSPAASSRRELQHPSLPKTLSRKVRKQKGCIYARLLSHTAQCSK